MFQVVLLQMPPNPRPQHGDGKDDLGIFYGYTTERDVKDFVLPSSGTKFTGAQEWWDSGPGNWNWDTTTIFAGDFIGGNSYDELVGFYGYGGARSALFLFE